MCFSIECVVNAIRGTQRGVETAGLSKGKADITTLKHTHVRVVLQVQQEALLQCAHVGLPNLTFIPGFHAGNIARNRLASNLENIETWSSRSGDRRRRWRLHKDSFREIAPLS